MSLVEVAVQSKVGGPSATEIEAVPSASMMVLSQSAPKNVTSVIRISIGKVSPSQGVFGVYSPAGIIMVWGMPGLGLPQRLRH